MFSLPAILISRLPQNLQATVFMIMACAFFAAMSGLIRHISESVPPLEIVFFRNVFGLMALLPWFLRNGFGALKTNRIGLYLVRGSFGSATMCFWFWGVSLVPLAEATALSFTAPLFATILAIFFLGEKVGIRRWTATLVGFAGTMIILRPAVSTIEPGTIMIIASAALMACASIFLKKLMTTDSPAQAVAWGGIIMVPTTFIPALFVWVWPSPESLLWLLLLGTIATMANLCFTRAISLSDLTAILPYDFTRLPFVALIGYLVFSQVPDFWTWVGAAVIFSSSIYVSWRESKLERKDEALVAAAVGTSPAVDVSGDIEAAVSRAERDDKH
ncbi:MAG: DMT family transporter [Alphaproteobacteria bacterium]|nr:DMT family transporter [Alphaproteobacteria bacterium]MBT6385551.1 DMT family transporter [Alphaproteobacteria bacterium]